MTSETIWLAIGLAGQALFTGPFLVQWLASEYRRESVVPLAFWWFSLAGGRPLLSYSIWRQDPVFIPGRGLGLFVYARELMLIRSQAARAAMQ